ncbi:von Willebrand factor A domain-containing protein 7-like [Fundulus heteroclitus]|uniref:von Willebrand factor A domain-containing protein 7-like n=1 Tax=Fundulus heteroclitus TaxID=8078 RepID=UPI00165BE901|nr:von Willebrand factor A domain-containing protein 7-like [Fundulus heteroclitus]
MKDFYSHSNWVEIGNRFPNSNLIRANARVGNIAAKAKATCRTCNGDDCRNNILKDILENKILTSGYFSVNPFSKPSGKCSHGGFPDSTSMMEPKGGINKDTLKSSHGHLHPQAANMAIAATSQLLEDVRGAAGDRKFLEMMGLFKGKPLCFVVDTTGSMGDDIAAVKTVTASIIDSKLGTQDEPSVYVLVPFSDPGFGPLVRTTDPEVFKTYINSLRASGGGDPPELSLSGLQLALTGAPPNSEIFVFTDAPAKDRHLRNPLIALIEHTKSVVNFMKTNVYGVRHQSHADGNQQQNHQMVKYDGQLYRDLAQTSGGQAVEVSKSQLLEAIDILTESTSSSLVTILQAVRNPGKAGIWTFPADQSVRNLTIYITGRNVDFMVIDPSGVVHNNKRTGSSIISSQMVGNLQTVKLLTLVGVWKLKIESKNPYSLKVVGESSIDFLFDFIKESDGPFGGFDVIDNRPTAGSNASLLVTLIGSDVATVTEVTLVESSGSGQVNGTMEALGGGEYFVRFDRIPSVEQAENNQQQNVRMARADGQLYRDLAQASGGQAVEVTKSQLLEAISVLTESTSSAQVVLLQAARNLGKAENYTFTVDESVRNATIYITGATVGFTLISPSGVIQSSANTTGSSTFSYQSVGNLQTLQLKTEPGVWEIRIESTIAYSLKVVGESSIDFIFDFIEESNGVFGGFKLIENRPTAGSNASLLVTLIGSEVATVTEVILVESSGSGQVNGTVEPQGGGEYFVRFDRIPSVEFVVLVKGQNNNGISRASSGIFQRQSTTSLRASVLTVSVDQLDTVFEPGTSKSVPFSVTTTGGGGSFTIQATNDKGFTSSFSSSLSLDAGGSANATVNITAPANTPSGTVITLTIEAVAPEGADTNYAVLRLSVLTTVTDFTQPVCELLSLQSNCSDNCSQSTWELSVQVTDEVNGTGLDSVRLREGNGTLNISTAADNENATLVSYVASCCSPDVELVAVDQVGNAEICRYSVRRNVSPAATAATQDATTSSPVTPAVTSFSTRVDLSIFLCFCFTVLSFLAQPLSL